jgi:hypothetical protein
MRARALFGSLAATATLAVGIPAMVPASAAALPRTEAECDAYVEDAIYYWAIGDYHSYDWNLTQAEYCYNEKRP